MGIVISVENLSKKYSIQQGTSGGNLSLRDALTQGFREQVKKFTHRSSTTSAKEFWALRDVSFDIEQGERVGIIGRNGAGKSTLLKIISRITEPTAGRVRIRGRVASMLEVGTGFHRELSGRENVFLNGAILGMSAAEIRKRFDCIVDFAEIQEFIDMPLKQYSTGMYMRLAFAVASHLDPAIFIVDEVLAVGDVAFQNKCLAKMKAISEDGRTILFVSHAMDVIKEFCQRVLQFKNGVLVNSGSVLENIEEYLT